MKERITKILLIAPLVVSLGFHWTFIQSVAWVSMIADYSEEMSVSEAITTTLSGEEPCQLCRMAEEAQQDEHQRKSIDPDAKFKLILCHSETLLQPPPRFRYAPHPVISPPTGFKDDIFNPPQSA